MSISNALRYFEFTYFYLPIGDPNTTAKPDALPADIRSRFSCIAYSGKCRLINIGNFKPIRTKPPITRLPNSAPM